MAIDPAWIALLGTIFGGIGLKAAENWMGRHRSKVDDAKNIRDELRLQDAVQKEEIKNLEADVNKWRGDYYDLRDKYISMQTELTIALHEIKKQAEEVIEKEIRDD